MLVRHSVPQTLVLAALTAGLGACGSAVPVEVEPAKGISTFRSADHFDEYVDLWAKAAANDLPVPISSESSVATDQAFDSGAQLAYGDDSITNNQEQGVDEGDIVKALGSHLVILRRGRLFTVEMAAQADADLRPVDMIAAYPEGSSDGTWYDEMLIHQRTVVVIGYSYRVGATEVGLFEVDTEGRLSHRDTFFLSSNDYYSSRNYTSRLVDGVLVFYMPSNLFRVDYSQRRPRVEVHLPGLARRGVRGAAESWQPILAKSDICPPVQRTRHPALHTVVRCDLKQPTFGCTARSLIGPYSRSFYVSADSVYLWIGAEHSDEQDESMATLYRLPLDGSAPTATRAYGMPIDQFSFKESKDVLKVLTRRQGGGEAMWMGEFSSGELALLQLPMSRFAASPTSPQQNDYEALPTPKSYGLQNRFVAGHLLYGAGGTWYDEQDRNQTLYVKPLDPAAGVVEVPLAHSIDRIEVMGPAAVVVGSAHADTHFTSIRLQDQPAVAHSFVRKNAVQGEARSHGFFFKSQADGSGLLGLPVQTSGATSDHLFRGSAQVQYLAVSAEQAFTDIGVLAAADDGSTDDQCVVSCVDWYGNARPIFYRGRIFALMGYELVEGERRNGALWESGRTHFYRDMQ